MTWIRNTVKLCSLWPITVVLYDMMEDIYVRPKASK